VGEGEKSRRGHAVNDHERRRGEFIRRGEEGVDPKQKSVDKANNVVGQIRNLWSDLTEGQKKRIK